MLNDLEPVQRYKGDISAPFKQGWSVMAMGDACKNTRSVVLFS